MTQIQIEKRDGSTEDLDLEKMHKVVFYACEDITGVSASEVEIKSHLSFYSGIRSVEIQETLIKSAADLISEDKPNYQWVAGRLINYHLRKQVYGQFDPWSMKELVIKNIERGFYDPEILEMYDDEEWDQLDTIVKHERDENMTYAAMEQFRGKYLVKNTSRCSGVSRPPKVSISNWGNLLSESFKNCVPSPYKNNNPEPPACNKLVKRDDNFLLPNLPLPTSSAKNAAIFGSPFKFSSKVSNKLSTRLDPYGNTSPRIGILVSFGTMFE